MNVSFFSLHFDLFSIIAKEVNQIRYNVVCVVARLILLFCCAHTAGRYNAFQHNFEYQKKSEFYGPYSPTMFDMFVCYQDLSQNFLPERQQKLFLETEFTISVLRKNFAYTMKSCIFSLNLIFLIILSKMFDRSKPTFQRFMKSCCSEKLHIDRCHVT